MTDFITKINGVLLIDYDVALLDYKTGAINLSGNYFKADKRLRPVIFNSEMPLRTITIRLEIMDSSDEWAEATGSKLTAIFSKETELTLPDGYYYRCVLDKTKEPVRIAKGIFVREFSLVGYRHGKMITETITETSDIKVQGNYKTEVRYTITPSSAIVTINGITINEATGEIIVIDGVDCLVTENGINKFADCDMTEFPCLETGTQTIQISGASSVKIEYYPIYY